MSRLMRAGCLFLIGLLTAGTALLYKTPPAGIEPATLTAEPGTKAVELVAVGDIMLARKVERMMQAYGDDYPFAKIADEIYQADIAFGNLESPLSTRGRALPGKGICFRARPALAGQLAEKGFDVLSIANNHALDYDTPAFNQTRQVLQEAGIATVGGGKNIDEARRPVILEAKGLKIGFLAYTDYADVYFHPRYPRRFQATNEVEGVAPLVEQDIRQDINAIRPRVDILVVSLHWGVEYSHRPTAAQQRMAHAFIDSGADLILGHHPHVLQGIERYNRGLIAYSLGNFIFDQNHRLETRQALMLKARITAQGLEEASIYPVFIDQSQPRLVAEEEARGILPQLQSLSAELGTTLEVGSHRAVLPRQSFPAEV